MKEKIAVSKILFFFLIALLTSFVTIKSLFASPYVQQNSNQVTISGTVVDADTGDPLAGVNIVVEGTMVGVATNAQGQFSLNVGSEPPITLIASIIGYTTQEIIIDEQNVSGLEIELSEETILGNDVVVSASRVEQSILEAPVSIEKMDIISVNQTASPTYYQALKNLKGVDMTTSSINFQIINARGFNSTGNTRMVQLTDGMDTQAPALNFPIGNLNGPSVLDVESVEFIPGASSALYGPNAFNGILLVNSKNPYRYPGLSVNVKTSVNHLNSRPSVGEPDAAQPMYDFAARYAKVINDRFAFKVNFSYSQAQDWVGINYSDKNASLAPSGVSNNPAYDGVHLYGDDGSFNIGLLSLSSDFVSGITQGLVSSPIPISAQDAQMFAQSLPAQPVTRTGYREEHLVDHDASNLKFGGSVHYRFTDNLEGSYTANYGSGTSVYSGAQRYSLKDFYIHQHKLQFEGDNFIIRGYGTFENSVDSYIADFVGFSINDQYMNTTDWYAGYGANFVQSLVLAQLNQTGTTEFNPEVVQALLSNPSTLMSFHDWARNGNADFGITGVDANRIQPGTDAFQTAYDNAVSDVVPNGARFDDQSRFLHTEGLYNFKNEISFVDLQVGLSFRQYQLRSNGTIFDDENGGVDINEYGGFMQASKSLLEDRLRLTGSIRYDKNENFDGQFNPRISSVIKVSENQNLRASYQTGFRNPTTQGQYIDLNVLTARLLGGLPYLSEKYRVTEGAFTLESVERFTNALLENPQEQAQAAAQLRPYQEFEPVKPEQIQSFEIGYKGLLGNKLLIDAAYYYNVYDDFIAQFRVRKASVYTEDNAPDPRLVGQLNLASLLQGTAENTFQLYTNVTETVKSQGAVLGFEYSLPSNFKLSANYNWNKLITDQDEGFIFDFNTPEHKVNLSLGNRRLTDQLGFNVTFRWQEEFEWTSSFANGTVPSVSTLDAQFTYRVPSIKSMVKVGGSNITNNRHFLNYGGPNLGAIYYVSLTFDQFLN
ncbi:MAG: TonB-dependent receptor [Balneolaceae bacterium]|nr:TonB-dependent receptor [Balneolaceae bacterium]